MKNKKPKDIDLQMKKMMKLAMMVALTAFAAACSNQDDMPNNENGATEFSVVGVINGYEEVADSRAKAETVVRIYWEGGEKVYVYDGKTYIGSLTATVSEDNHAIAKLGGTLNKYPSGNKPLTLVYSPKFNSYPFVNVDKIKLDLTEQDTDYVPFLIYGVLTGLNNKNVTDQVVNFQFATSVYKCNAADLVSGSAITKATIDNINTYCVLTLSDNAIPTVGSEDKGTITLTNPYRFMSADERAIFTFALPVSPAVEEETTRTITVTQQGDEQGLVANFDNREIKAAKAFNAMFVFAEPGSDSDSDSDNGDYVDIAGVRWATMNLGATTIAGDYNTCVGDIYQWGSRNTLYSSKYFTAYGSYNGDWNFSWKPGKSGGFSFDNLEYKDETYSGDMLPDDNDVVMQTLGDGWRMPTADDFKSLVGACIDNPLSGPANGNFSYYDINYLDSENPSGGIYYVAPDQYYLQEYQGVGGMLFVVKDNTTKRLFFPFGLTVDNSAYQFRYNRAYYHVKNASTESGLNFLCRQFTIEFKNSNEKVVSVEDYTIRADGRFIRPVKDINN